MSQPLGMLRARKEGRSEDEVIAEAIAEASEDHQKDFAGFQVQFDNYGSTNSVAAQAHRALRWHI